ncbi:unnamed protein product [marine sediment metagenome]|uniref:Uncharacterized protein n=1 Tax=marine sediment metagenome TaxID=412755 RepID=X1QYD1_9ZZZZ
MAVQTRTTALQNEVVRLYCKFERDGMLTNPAGQPIVEIIDADGVTILATLHAAIENTGIWFADWFVPTDLPLGSYYDKWTFQWGANTGVTELNLEFTVHGLDSYINFISPAISHTISNRVAQLMLDLSNEFIYEAMHIPVYWEQGMRIQQDEQQKRRKDYYYFTLDHLDYIINKDDVYFNNSQKYTVFQDIYPPFSSSSSSSEWTNSSSSTSSIDSSSSSSI